MLNAECYGRPGSQQDTIGTYLHGALTVLDKKLFKSEAHNARARSNRARVRDVR